MSRKIGRDFFEQPTVSVAKKLLGCFLVRKIGKKIYRAMITETEAYLGPNDKASHASYGRTKRTEIMFGKAGHAYVYLIYGMYYCFNIVTEKQGYPAAVLIRAVHPILSVSKNVRPDIFRDKEPKLVSGPGRVCRYFKIDKYLNSEDIIIGKKIWLEYGTKISLTKIISAPRIGVDYAGSKWQHKKWRFYLK
ncbi:MAG: DNA-3-methyladenine glycosylase [Patescibacteria group bacterium]